MGSSLNLIVMPIRHFRYLLFNTWTIIVKDIDFSFKFVSIKKTERLYNVQCSIWQTLLLCSHRKHSRRFSCTKTNWLAEESISYWFYSDNRFHVEAEIRMSFNSVQSWCWFWLEKIIFTEVYSSAGLTDGLKLVIV